MKPFDTHAHLYDKQFDKDRENVLADTFQKLDYVLCPSENLETSLKTVQLVEKYPCLYGAVGIHPHETGFATESVIKEITDLARQNKKIKAIGEIGLDYYYFRSPKEIQQKWFKRQIEIGIELNLPVIIHDRDAHGDTLQILKEFNNRKLRGIIHCFSGSIEFAKEIIKLGFFISFSGSLVFPGSTRLKQVAREISLDNILIETDSPYLSPPPHRGERNYPGNVIYVAEEIAALKGISVSRVIRQTKENAMSIYQIQNQGRIC